MHRHSYQGRKFHRQRDQRRALIKGLADSLIEHGSIETTLAKAAELRPYTEKLISKAKKGDLHSRRQLISQLQTTASAHKLVDEIAPKLKNRDSGYLRIEKSKVRRGDGAPLARVSFVDDLTKPVNQPKAEETPKDTQTSQKPAVAKTETPKKPSNKTKRITKT